MMILSFIALVLAAPPAANVPEKPITFWASSSHTVDVANTKLVTLDKMPTKVKLGRACAGSAGVFQGWQVVSVDPRGSRDGQIFEIVSNGVPANAETLSSLRVEGSCTEAGTTWTKYSAIVEKPAVPRKKPVPQKTPAKTGKEAPAPTK